MGLGYVAPHRITYSEKGWMTGELLIDTLHETRELPRFADGAKMAVVIDQAPCHMTIDVALKAAQMGMALIPVPPGSTGNCPPMDVRPLRVFKRRQSKLRDDPMRACLGWAWIKADAVRTIIDTWAEIDVKIVNSAWQRARGGGEGV
jgi:hypothetical protein